MTHDDIKARIAPTLNVFKSIRDAVDLAERTVNTADRERIAELERDLNDHRCRLCLIAIAVGEGANYNHAGAGVDRVVDALATAVADLDEANANLVELRTNFAQNAAITEALRVELAEARQGPWVIQLDDTEAVFALAPKCGPTRDPECAHRYLTKEAAKVDADKGDPMGIYSWRIITLAEARRIAAVKP